MDSKEMQQVPAPPGYVQPAPQYGGQPDLQYGQQAQPYGQPVVQYGQPAPPAVVATPAATTVVVQQGNAAPAAPMDRKAALYFFRENSVRTVCPACQAEVMTSIHYEVGTFVWVSAGLLIFFGLWLGCCVIPFFLNVCKDVVHSCPRCRHGIGRYNRV